MSFPGWGAAAADDWITRYTYDGIGNVLTMTADLPGGSNDQTTQYVYSVTIGSGNLIAANDLLKEVRYPNAGREENGTGPILFIGPVPFSSPFSSRYVGNTNSLTNRMTRSARLSALGNYGGY